jgi:hypothetical protein
MLARFGRATAHRGTAGFLLSAKLLWGHSQDRFDQRREKNFGCSFIPECLASACPNRCVLLCEGSKACALRDTSFFWFSSPDLNK